MKVLEQIEKTREYLDYLEEHIENVRKAWLMIQEKCQDMQIIYDDSYYNIIGIEVMNHDLSKMSENEFVQYRKSFYPVHWEEKYDITDAWEHHKRKNPHHWENWTKNSNNWKVDCTHMIIDWLAMSFKFGDTAQEFYENNKYKIWLPDYAIDFIYEIFKRVYGE